MLVQFSFSNFKCFKDETVLNLTTSRKKNKEFYSIDTRFGYRVLKSLAVYGANASGKSKLFEAVKFLKILVLNAKDTVGESLWKKKYEKFRLSTESENKNSSFEVVFIIDDNQYRYEIELTNEIIITECLYIKENKREVEVFKRTPNKITYNERFGKIAKTLINGNMIKGDMPFLSALNEWNDKMAQRIILWFKDMNVISGNELPSVPINFIRDETLKNLILSFLKMFDINIEDIAMHETSADAIPDKIKELIGREHFVGQPVYDGISTKHKVYDEHYSVSNYTNFQMEEQESYGTNRLIRLCLPILSTLQNSSVLLIDEFDSGIHPNILNYLISMFYTMGKKSQLIVNTHNSSLLSRDLDYEFIPVEYLESENDIDFVKLLETTEDITIKHPKSNKYKLFIKDQIYFVTKNRYGVASLVPLTDFKNIRSNIEQLYLEGLLDGTPNIRRYEIPTFLSTEDGKWGKK